MSTTTKTDEKTLLAPLEIWEVLTGNQTIKFYQPLVLVPTRMPHDPDEPGDEEYWEVEMPSLNISAYGRDREELLRSIQDDIRVMWKTFVQKDDARLDRDTLSIKRNYLELAEVLDE